MRVEYLKGRKKLWARLGVELDLTEEEEKALLSNTWELWTSSYHPAALALAAVLREGRYKVTGESYIPASSVAEYNEINGTLYVEEDRDLDIEWEPERR